MSAVVGVFFPAYVDRACFQNDGTSEPPPALTSSDSAAAHMSGAHLDVLRRLATEEGLDMTRLQAAALVVPLGDIQLEPANEPAAGALAQERLAVETAVPLPVQRPIPEGGPSAALERSLRSRLSGMTADAEVPIIVTADLRAAAQRADADGLSTEPRVSVFDMGALQHTWSTPEMRSIFCEGNRVHQWLRVEVALAMVQARLGIIPAETAQAIARAAKLENVHLGLMAEGIREINHSLVPLLRQVQGKVDDPVAGEAIHGGLTTQDTIDTGLVLQMKQAHEVYLRDLGELGRVVADLASAHRDTVMAGRTHLVHAAPITFGHKCAIWLDELGRHSQRLRQCEPRVFLRRARP